MKKTRFFKLLTTVVIVFVIGLHNPLIAQNSKFLIGEGYAENNDPNQALIIAKKRAMADLASQIKAKIHSEFENSMTESAAGIDEYTRSKIKVIADMEIDGVEYQIERQPRVIIARAVLNRSRAGEIYFNKCKNLLNELNQRLKQIDKLFQADDRKQALSELLVASKIFNELEQSMVVYAALGGSDYKSLQLPLTHAQLDKKITQLSQRKINNFSDALSLLCFQLSRQMPAGLPYKIFPFEYEDSGFGSTFSEYVRRELESLLPEFLPDRAKDAFGKNSDLFISGTYWLRPDLMVVIAQIQDRQGKVIGSARVQIPLAIVDSLRINYKPGNFSTAQSENAYFDDSRLVYGNLKLSVWTNRGGKDLLFRQGERLRIFARVNQPSYLRCVYHLANGMRTPLVENFYIDPAMVNKAVEISKDYEIICAPPFGVERLQIFASTEKFPPLDLKTIEIEGEKYEVLAQDLPQFLAATRGFIRKKAGKSKAAERIITITTIPANMMRQ
ncbi:MAG: DUF4384 domain-containing protein [Calditrichaeota bacterium]|nr:DUF4384 domain-containing protein [Calditrichota bacterium]